MKEWLIAIQAESKRTEFPSLDFWLFHWFPTMQRLGYFRREE